MIPKRDLGMIPKFFGVFSASGGRAVPQSLKKEDFWDDSQVFCGVS